MLNYNRTDLETLVKYCFSGSKSGNIELNEICQSSLNSLKQNGIIDVPQEKRGTNFDEDTDLYYDCSPIGDEYYVDCSERQDEDIVVFPFVISYSIETYSKVQILIVEILSDSYDVKNLSKQSCLECLKHEIRKSVGHFSNKYCLYDKQSQHYSELLYPLVYRVENSFRFYINEVFLKTFGSDWLERAVEKSLIDNRKNRIENTQRLSGKNADLHPFLLSLEVNDLIKLAQTKLRKWNPVFDQRIEDVINKKSRADLTTLLYSQCDIKIDIWDRFFAPFLGEDFLDDFHLFEKYRNQIAHNKLIEFDVFYRINELCNKLIEEVSTAYVKYSSFTISEEEQELINDIKSDLEIQEINEEESLRRIAEEESGVTVYNQHEIHDILLEICNDIKSTVEDLYWDRDDINIGEIVEKSSVQYKWEIIYSINSIILSIDFEFEIDNTPGAQSNIVVQIRINDDTETFHISFSNGEYEFDQFQSCYLPLTEDGFSEPEVCSVKNYVCDKINMAFPNLKELADSKSYLESVGKDTSIVYPDVFCENCGEEYLCCDERVAEKGICLNCGTKNYIAFCSRCGLPIEAYENEKSFDTSSLCDKCKEGSFVADST